MQIQVNSDNSVAVDAGLSSSVEASVLTLCVAAERSSPVIFCVSGSKPFHLLRQESLPSGGRPESYALTFQPVVHSAFRSPLRLH